MPDEVAGAIEQTPSGVIVRIYAAPRASANKVVGLHDGAIKIALAAPPVDGAANRALIEFLAKLLDVPRNNITLVSGETSRNKVVRIAGIEAATAHSKLVNNNK